MRDEERYAEALRQINAGRLVLDMPPVTRIPAGPCNGDECCLAQVFHTNGVRSQTMPALGETEAQQQAFARATHAEIVGADVDALCTCLECCVVGSRLRLSPELEWVSTMNAHQAPPFFSAEKEGLAIDPAYAPDPRAELPVVVG